jgi:hypothetical protein
MVSHRVGGFHKPVDATSQAAIEYDFAGGAASNRPSARSACRRLRTLGGRRPGPGSRPRLRTFGSRVSQDGPLGTLGRFDVSQHALR